MKKVCIIDGCGKRPYPANGKMCSMHKSRMLRNGRSKSAPSRPHYTAERWQKDLRVWAIQPWATAEFRQLVGEVR